MFVPVHRNSKMHGRKSSGVNQLKKSLGIDLDESGLSWTSSLATPPTHVILEGFSFFLLFPIFQFHEIQ